MFYQSLPRLLWEAPAWFLRQRYGTRVTFYKARAALGDALMLTPLLRELKRLRPDWKLEVATRHPELFYHNPHLAAVRDWHLWKTRGLVRPRYSMDEPNPPHYIETLWADLWRQLVEAGMHDGPTPPLASRHPEIFLTAAESAAGRAAARAGTREGRPLIALVSGGKTSPTHNREWGYANYAALAAALRPHADLLQFGLERALQPTNAGAPLRRAQGSLRELAAQLHTCDMLLNQEGGLMHIARAVNCPQAVIYGGTLWPEHSAYDLMYTLGSKPSCSPCRHTRQNCSHLMCMHGITPRAVASAVRQVLAENGRPELPLEAVERAPDVWEPPEFVDRQALERALAGHPPLAPVAI